MNVTTIGIGDIGLITGVMLEVLEHTVTCLDIDELKLDLLLADNSLNFTVCSPKLQTVIACDVKHTIALHEVKSELPGSMAKRSTLGVVKGTYGSFNDTHTFKIRLCNE